MYDKARLENKISISVWKPIGLWHVRDNLFQCGSTKAKFNISRHFRTVTLNDSYLIVLYSAIKIPIWASFIGILWGRPINIFTQFWSGRKNVCMVFIKNFGQRYEKLQPLAQEACTNSSQKKPKTLQTDVLKVPVLWRQAPCRTLKSVKSCFGPGGQKRPDRFCGHRQIS